MSNKYSELSDEILRPFSQVNPIETLPAEQRIVSDIHDHRLRSRCKSLTGANRLLHRFRRSRRRSGKATRARVQNLVQVDPDANSELLSIAAEIMAATLQQGAALDRAYTRKDIAYQVRTSSRRVAKSQSTDSIRT